MKRIPFAMFRTEVLQYRCQRFYFHGKINEILIILTRTQIQNNDFEAFFFNTYSTNAHYFMELKLSFYGEPVLRKKASPVTQFDQALKTLIKDMEETMHIHNGIGLAAPQVGISQRIFITCVPELDENEEYSEEDGTLRVYINPTILEYSQETTLYTEGCLSIPHIQGQVERPLRVKVKAFDVDGNEFIHEAEELEAHCILHENDHINGVLFIDRVRGKERQKLESLIRQRKSVKTKGNKG